MSLLNHLRSVTDLYPLIQYLLSLPVLRDLLPLAKIELRHLKFEDEVLILTAHEAAIEKALKVEVAVSARTAAGALVLSINASDLCLAMIVL